MDAQALNSKAIAGNSVIRRFTADSLYSVLADAMIPPSTGT